LSFDPASISPTILEVDDQPQPTAVTRQLQRIKDLLSAPIDTLVQHSEEMKHILEEVKPQLPEALQIKLWPVGHLPFLRAKVESARQRIEARSSQAPLKADMAQRCWLLNKKKVALDAKTDTSASTQKLELLEKELEDFKEKVRATEQFIQNEKAFIASSKQEAVDLIAQLKTEVAELSTLSRQRVAAEDKDDEAVIAEADSIHVEAIRAIEVFLQ
jgi:hypothetical protein